MAARAIGKEELGICNNDLETATQEAAILAGVMRLEAFKLEHYD